MLAFLSKRGFIVEDSKDEVLPIKDKYESLRNGEQNIVDLCLVMNNTCNLACTYCYQNHSGNTEISNETLDKVAFALKDELAHSAETIMVHFFGGEPSLSIDKIRYFSNKITKADINNIEYYMTTNGYKLDRESIIQLISLNVKQFQITVDGNPSIHNKQRIAVNGSDTYSKILSNIENILELSGDVTIRINITKHNYNHLSELFDDILAIKKKEYTGNVDFAINEAIDYSKDQDSQVYFENRREYSKYLLGVYRKMRKKGFSIPYPSRDSFCTMMSSNGYVINNDGSFGYCSASNEDVIGHIDNGFKCTEMTSKRVGKSALDDEVCIKCKYFPVCYGGCKLLGDMKKEKCSFFKHLMPELMKLNADGLCDE